MKRSLAVFLGLTGLSVALAFIIYTPSASGNEGKFIRKADPIPGRYIVVFDDKPGENARPDFNVEAKAYEIAGNFGGTVEHVYTSALKGFSIEMSEKAAEELSQDPRVLYVEEDAPVYPASPQTAPDWGLDRIDQRGLPLDSTYLYAENGAGVNVYVIDSGIRPTHVDFGGRASVAFDALNDGQNGIDCTGHGTHVAGIIGSATYGVAKAATLRAVRVLPCSGTGSTATLISGVDWVTANRVIPAVANISITASGTSSVMDAAINNAISSGVTFTVAAGNSGLDACNFSPARIPNALTVGATTTTDARAPYSNFGSCLDIFAPGHGITSLSHASDTGTSGMSGTSMASPFVAGLAALYLGSNPGASPTTVGNRIKSDATAGSVGDAGTGSPNRLGYSWLGGAQPPVPGTVTIIKEVRTMTNGTSSTDGFTYAATNLGAAGFMLIDNDAPPSDRFVNSSIYTFDQPGAITVTESSIAGWSTTSISCTESNTQNSTVDMANKRASLMVEEGESVTCTFFSQQFAPTASLVSVAGRVANQGGSGVRGVSLTIVNLITGEQLTARTNSFGFYNFRDLPSANFYILRVNGSKRYVFTPDSHSFTLEDDLGGMDFTALSYGP